MCGETREYQCYPECTLKNAGGFFNRFLDSTSDELSIHKITIRTIQLCPNAVNPESGPPCGNLKNLMPNSTLQKIAYSEFSGECPACVNGADAAAAAVQQACLRTVYVKGFDGTSDQGSAAGSAASKESSSTIKPRKTKADKKKSKK